MSGLTSGNIILLLIIQIQYCLFFLFFNLYFISQPATSALSSSRKDIQLLYWQILLNADKKKCIQ